MKFSNTIFIIILLIFSSFSFAQQLDPSILKELTPDQVKTLTSNLQKTIENPVPVISESTIKVDTKNDKLNQNLNEVSKKYGYDYFSSIPTTITAVGDLPLPNDYKISLKDQFTIILSGSKELVFDADVKLDGTILFPEIGSVSVVGETFSEVKDKLRSLVESSYIGVRLDLSIKNLSAKKVTIVGAIKNPGTYLVNPFSTITSTLGYSGGILEIGTLRNIKLIRNNKETFYFDLYELLIDGDRTRDITIEAGDVILVDPADQFIALSGQVKRPAIYEIKDDETLKDLIKFGLGFTKIANKTNINFTILNINSSEIQKINKSDMSLSLNNVLSVDVNPYINKNTANINVRGAIKEPGYYPLNQDEYLEDFIKRLEFIDVYPWLAVLEQFDDEKLLKTSTLFNLNDPDTFRSIKLLPNSNLYFANLNSRSFDVSTMTMDLISDYSLTINHNQGTFSLPVYGNFSVKSFIDLLGLDMSDVDSEATYISPLESKVVVENYEEMKFFSNKYSVLSFRSPINDLISVTISGAVDYPGTYILKANSTLQDLYELIGNLKPEAFRKGIVLTRASIRERQLQSINKSRNDLNEALLMRKSEGDKVGDIEIIQSLSQSIEPQNLGRVAGDFAPGSKAAKKTILLNNDSIIIPKNPNVINVLGEVLNPIAFEYSKNLNVYSAISAAGGFRDYADKNKIYVIKANGLIKKEKKSVITRITTLGIFPRRVKLEPGDTIIVPRKIITRSPGLETLIPISQIISNIAFAAAALDNLIDDQ